MIPDFVDIGPPAPWPVLPPGIHLATMEEIEARFATNPHRKRLFGGFERVVANLTAAGCIEIFLDGGFVSESPIPNDFDGIWNPVGVDASLVDPVLLTFDKGRMMQKWKYSGEMFFTLTPADRNGTSYLEFFQNCRYSGRPKGILQVDV